MIKTDTRKQETLPGAPTLSKALFCRGETFRDILKAKKYPVGGKIIERE